MPKLTIDLDNLTAEDYLAVMEAMDGKVILGDWDDYEGCSIRWEHKSVGRICVQFVERLKQPWEIVNHSTCVRFPDTKQRQRFKTREAAKSAVDQYLATLPDVRAVGVKGE